MRDDQASLLVVPQEVFEQNLGTQVEEVGRFVQQQQVRIMQQQRGQLHAGLPSTGELSRPVHRDSHP